MTCTPETLFVLPDPLLTGRRNIASVTSEAGPLAPVFAADESNRGSMSPIATGAPASSTSPTYDLIILRSGGIVGAAFAWKPSAESVYRGADDGRKVWRMQAPFIEPTHPDQKDIAATYLRRQRKLVLVTIDDVAGELIFRTRGESVDYDAWTETTLDPTTINAPAIQTSTTPIHRVAICETPDGFLLVAYTYFIVAATVDEYGVAVIRSDDGGTTWERLHTDLLDGTNNISHDEHPMRLTRSGSWIRLDWTTVGAAPRQLVSRASPDGGLSWTPRVTSGFDLSDAAVASDPSPFGVAGLGNGIFLAMTIDETAGDKVHNASAHAGDAWVKITSGAATEIERTLPATCTGIALCASQDRVYALVGYEDGGGSNVFDQMTLLYHAFDGIFDLGPGEASPGSPDDIEWQPIEPLFLTVGARFTPTRATLLDAGDRLIAVYSLWDPIDGAARVARCVLEIGGTSVRSFGKLTAGEALGSLDPAGGSAVSLPLYHVFWGAPTGRPAGGSTAVGGGTSPDTAWVESTAGAATVTYTPDSLQVVTGAGDATSWRYTDTSSSSTDSWLVRGSTAGATVRINSGSSQSATRHALRIQSETSTAGDIVRFELRMDTTGITVHDILGASDVASISIDLTKWCEVRVAFRDNAGTYECVVVAFEHGDYYGNVVSSSTFTLTGSTIAGNDEIEFGSIATGSGDSEWRDTYVARGERDIGFSSPEDLLGIATTWRDYPLESGIDLSWGGGAAAETDVFTSESRYEHGAENALLDACVIDWRSGGSSPLATQTLILVADPDDDARILEHDAVILCGIEDRTVLIDYANTIGFGSPTATSTLDTTLFTNLEVTSAAGKTLTYSVAANTRTPIQGELAGMRVRFTSGAASGVTLCVTRHCDDTLHFDDASDDLPTLGVGTGDDFVVFAPYGLVEHSATRRRRFMRLRFTDSATCTGDHRCGAILPGCTLELPIPLEWTHSDDEASDVEVFEGPNVSWAYTRGAPRRVWSARVVADYVRWRETLRYLMRHLAGYEAKPIGVVPDRTEPRRLMRARLTPGEHENSFWWNQDDGDGEYRFPGGDQQLRFVEVL